MSRHLLFVMIASASLGTTACAVAQQASQPDSSYQGVSRPPKDDIVTTPDSEPIAKPSAGKLAVQPDAVPAQQETQQPQVAEPIVESRPQPSAPAIAQPAAGEDPDSDIVHARPARPGELLEGTTIRVRLVDRVSSVDTAKGASFRGQVASDVLQDGKVLIPSGSEIEGRVTSVTTGAHLGGHGSFRLKPEAVILPDGSRFQLHAETTGTPGSKTRIGSEGSINPGSRAKRNGIEYGAVMGTGAVTGAVLGGPVGALTGTLVGAGIVTTHIMVDHPQATLEPGSILLFSLTEPMNLTPATTTN